VLAFYDGRVPGYRFAEDPNWVDDGALSLGIASYAVVSDGKALVYDTNVSVDHAQSIREALEAEDVRETTVVLSHWHLDHVAGTEVFADCEVISSSRTAEHLARHRGAIEAGELEGPPPINPLILPTRTFDERLELRVGDVEVHLLATNIHSDDAALLWLPRERLLFCGDTMEDTATYVDEPESFDTHLGNLAKLHELAPDRILPNHGDPEVIADGGYGPDLLDATEGYISLLLRARDQPGLRELPLRDLIRDWIDSGAVHYFEPYEEVHRLNLEKVLASGRS
jgi:cyclase